jgi:lysophospholipase L1-like esterase
MTGRSVPVRLVVALLGAALLLAGCTSAERPAPAAPPSPVGKYVALGDSFTAGPLIPTTDLAGGCARSDHNYPSLVADAADVGRLVDVSCSGARTLDLTGFQRPFEGSRVPPQLRALTPDTTLVTLGIGGNDLALFATLISTCTRLRSTDPDGAPCARALAANGPDLDAAVGTISRRVVRALQEIRSRAPEARVLLVGYLRLVPDRGTCVALPLAAGDYAEGRQISRVLDRALHRAARRSGVTFVDMYAASRGHDICSSRPWVNGSVTDRQKALAYHPFAVGMRATAREIVRILDTP